MSVQAQGWSPEQLAQANTAASADFMTPEEKEAVLYINLCRLFPKDFLALEVNSCKNSGEGRLFLSTAGRFNIGGTLACGATRIFVG
jgi:hypothetical protein